MKNNRMRFSIYLISLLISIFLKNISSQPYYYYSVKQDTTLLSDIHRIDFSNGIDFLFIKGYGRINKIYWNSDQTNLFISQRNSAIDVVRLDSLNKFQRISEGITNIMNIHDAPITNRVFIEYGDEEKIYKYTVSYDRKTYFPLDTLVFYNFGGTFLSKDESKLYSNIWDTSGVFFSAYDLLNNRLIYSSKKTTNLGPSKLYYGMEDAKKGRSLFLHSDSTNYNKRTMFVCHPDSGLKFPPIPIMSARFDAHLSANAKYIILEEIDWNPKNNIAAFHTGKIFIYNAQSGEQISYLDLPPNGKVMVFDEFPNILYYFNRTTKSVESVNLVELEHNTVSLLVNFKDSQGNLIQEGSLQYYDAGWKDAVNNGDGSFNVETDRSTVSLRMNFAGSSQTVSNVAAQNNTYTFTTLQVNVQLKDSQGNLLDGGSAQYYASGWKEFGEVLNGEVTKELLPKEYSFRMSYGGTSVDKKQNIGNDQTVVFQTVNSNVQLKDSQGNLLGGGTTMSEVGHVQYYASGWRVFGEVENGEVTKELLPKEYSFRMSYVGASVDIKQDIGTDQTIVFQTVNAKVQLKDSQGNLLDGGSAQYYASGWKEFGVAVNGEVTKELLPKEYSFRMSYGGASVDIKQDIGTDQTIVFQTVNVKSSTKR